MRAIGTVGVALAVVLQMAGDLGCSKKQEEPVKPVATSAVQKPVIPDVPMPKAPKLSLAAELEAMAAESADEATIETSALEAEITALEAESRRITGAGDGGRAPATDSGK